MRELTKSMMSCTLAMSIFSIRQMMSIFLPGANKDGPDTTDAFNQITAAATGQLGQSMRATFQTSDKWQRQMVDVMFSPILLAPGKSGQWITKLAPGAQAPQSPTSADAPAAPNPPSPPPPTWSWGSARTSDGTQNQTAPSSAASSSSSVPTPPPSQPTAPDGQDTGWGPMP